jgi:L-ascorbate metabolism protein UlaG (beta-lactamase superfamily)
MMILTSNRFPGTLAEDWAGAKPGLNLYWLGQAGFAVVCEGLRLVIDHSGDSIPYEGLVEILRKQRIDLALLPVNGRDSERLARGIAGNFTLAEAIDLCQMARIPALMAHHCGMFAFNTIAPETIDHAATLEKRIRVYRAETNTRYCIKPS